MIRDVIFLLKQNYLFFSKRGMSEMLLWIIILVIVILVATLFIANQQGLFGKNVDGVLGYSGGLFGSTND